MPDDSRAIDPIWERKYASGHAQRYPWDVVVSFLFRNAPTSRPRADVRVLEVGCGTGANLWFAAREGFRVAGIDGSRSAVKAAADRFARDGLAAELKVGLLPVLPFDTASFDLVIDRAALTCVGRSVAHESFAEIHRVLRPAGRLLFNPYSDRHSSMASGRPGADGLVLEPSSGSLAGLGQICFYSRAQVLKALQQFRLHSLQHLELAETLAGHEGLHAEWRAVAEKEN